MKSKGILSDPDDFSSSIKSTNGYSVFIEYVFKLLEKSIISATILGVGLKAHSIGLTLLGGFLGVLICLLVWIKVYSKTINIPYNNREKFIFSKYGRIWQFMILEAGALSVMFFGSMAMANFLKEISASI